MGDDDHTRLCQLLRNLGCPMKEKYAQKCAVPGPGGLLAHVVEVVGGKEIGPEEERIVAELGEIAKRHQGSEKIISELGKIVKP